MRHSFSVASDMRTLLLLIICWSSVQAAEIRRTPWVWPATQQPIVDGYAWCTASDVREIQLRTATGVTVSLPFFSGDQAQLPLVSATAWHAQDRWQIMIRATSEDFLRTCHITVITASGPIPLDFTEAKYGTLLLQKAWGQDVFSVYYGGNGAAEVLQAGPVRISRQPSPYLYAPRVPFSWRYITENHAEPPSPTRFSDLAVAPAVELDLSHDAEWAFLSHWGMFPRMVFDLNWVGNPTIYRSLQACLPKGQGLATFYMGLASLGPVTQPIFLVSPELLSLWAAAPSTAHRRFLLAGAWMAAAFECPDFTPDPPKELGDIKQLITGRAQANPKAWLQELRAYQFAPLVPLVITRQSETYSQVLYSLADGQTYLWVDFLSNEPYVATQAEETVEIKLRGHTVTEALENLPMLAPIPE